MQNVTFGRVLKVNAPLKIADEIIETAKTDTELGYTLNRALFPERRGNARTFAYSEDKNESYIFTENEGLRFWDSHCKAWDEMDFAQRKYQGDKLGHIYTKAAWDRHFNNIKKMIKQADKIVNLNAEYDSETGKIKSVDILA